MEFEDALEDIAAKLADYGDNLTTEEATKNAIIMPFISQVLGYDVFNPKEVMPEFTADLGTKKGEKIDYAILHDGEVQMLIECKKNGDDLKLKNVSQLFRYFHASNARIGVLTNGRTWEFFTDLDQPNKMDERPFLVLDLLNIDPYTLPELKKLTKDAFDLESVLTAAEELKYVSSIKRALTALLDDPSDDLTRLLVSQVYEGSFTAKIREFFSPVVRKAIHQLLNDRVNARLKSALQGRRRRSGSQRPSRRVLRRGRGRNEPGNRSGMTWSRPPRRPRDSRWFVPSWPPNSHGTGSSPATRNHISECLSTTPTGSRYADFTSTTGRSTWGSSTRARTRPGSRSSQ